MQTECTLTINKSPSGWAVESVVKYPDWPNPVYTSSGNRTLAIALWDTIGHYMRLPDNPRLVAITVKGKPMTLSEAFRIIEKDLRGSALDYAIPGYHKFLEEA